MIDELIKRKDAIKVILEDKIVPSENVLKIMIDISGEGIKDHIETVNMACDRHIESIKNLQAEDVTSVKHGEWEILESFSLEYDNSHKDRCRCTSCGFIHEFTDFHYGQYNFCPECGAKMDGVV